MVDMNFKTLNNFALSLVFAAGVSSAVAGTEISQEKKHAIDPEYPVSSLCGAGQQFTVLRDNDHSSPLVPLAVAHELPNAAKNCDVKNLVLEYGLSIDDQETMEVMLRINGVGPKISKQELMEKSYLFEPDSAESPEQAKQYGEAYATMLAVAMNENVKVYFAGDYPGIEHSLDVDNYISQQTQLLSEKEKLISKDPELHRQYEIYIALEDRTQFDDYTSSLYESGMTDEDVNLHMSKMGDYSDKIYAFDSESLRLGGLASESQNLYESTRFSDEALESRAEKFIGIANGENTIVVWGSDHFNNNMNPKDIDEYLDEKLVKIAAEEGLEQQPYATKKIDLYPTREAFNYNVQNGYKGPDSADFNYIISEGNLQIPPAYLEQFNTEPSTSDPMTPTGVGVTSQAIINSL